ncbi:MAG: glycosyltransferase [candidate division KSB1 bacterium]|jgi:glycosyltransferase involved in cell wall biosynthesis|nr:glycosyltransferase [candidate division KSB1 bacterium]
MGTEPVVIHIDTERTWRGGQQQVSYLYEGLRNRGFQTGMICQPNSALENHLRGKHLPCHPIRMRNELDMPAGYRIAKYCRKMNANILQLHSAHALSIGLWAKLFCNDVKLIAVRRVDFHIRKSYLKSKKYNNRYLDVIVCISNRIKEVLREDGIPDNKLAVIHSGIDVSRYRNHDVRSDLKTRLNIPENHTIIGTVAAMAGHKDYPNLLRAASIVTRKKEDITFIAVGDGPDRDKIVSLHQKLGLGNRFILPGFKDNIGDYLNLFDIFVLASREEGMGTSILDAQAAGLPVVACAAGGIPEIVRHEYNGLLVPPKNPQALADATVRLVSDMNMRRNFSENAKASVLDFSIEKTVDKNIQLYHDLLAGYQLVTDE